MLGYLYYYLLINEKDTIIEKWLEDKGFIMATRALGIGGDYPGIVYIVYLGLLYSIIDFIQETRRGGQAGEDMDSIILLEDSIY